MNQQTNYRNSLSRIHRILADAAQENASNIRTVQVWKNVLRSYGYEISDGNIAIQSLELAEILSLFYRELTFAWAQLDDISDASLGYQAAFESVCSALSVINLHDHWTSRKQHLTPQVLTIVGLSAQLLPITSEIDEAEIEVLLEQLQEIEKNISAAELPRSFKQVLFHHVEVMLEALKRYRLIGANAFREALKEGLVSTSEHAKEFEKNDEKPVVQETLGAWQTIDKFLQKAKAVNDGTNALVSISERVFGILEQINK